MIKTRLALIRVDEIITQAASQILINGESFGQIYIITLVAVYISHFSFYILITFKTADFHFHFNLLLLFHVVLHMMLFYIPSPLTKLHFHTSSYIYVIFVHRKGTLLFNNIFSIGPAIMMGVSEVLGSFEIIIVSRFFVGICAGE